MTQVNFRRHRLGCCWFSAVRALPLFALLSACTGSIGTEAGAVADGGTPTSASSNSVGGGASSTSTSGGGNDGGSGSGTTGTTGTGGTIDRGSVSFECDPNTAPSVTPLRRLTRLQYQNTLVDLFAAKGVPGVVDAAESALAQLPPDGENDSVYSGNDARVTDRHVEAYMGVADDIASAITEDSGVLTSFAGDCAEEVPLSQTCLEGLVNEFGGLVFRRPLTQAEVDRYLELLDPAAAPAEIVRGVVFQMLMSPQFLYHFEVEGEAIDGDDSRLALGPWELASRLSFHFWQSMPDAELFDAARDGSLMTDAGFDAQVERLFEDPRTQVTLNKFWHEWYQLDGFAGFASTPAFEAFRANVEADDSLYQAMLDEVDELVRYYTFDTAGTYRDVLSSNLVFTTSADLAALYGVEAWDGAGDPPTFADSERSGLLTRAALLAEGNELTNPIKRGAFVLRSILCDDLHPPSTLPAEALALPEVDPDMSTRERFEVKTSPTECRVCHQRFNPFGFVLESFDALGRFRTEERVYDDGGELLNTVPIDPAADVVIDGESATVKNPVEFNEQLSQADIVDDCFARQYFRFTYRRDESTGDSCALASIRDNVAPGGSLRQALRDVALSPSFRERVVGAE